MKVRKYFRGSGRVLAFVFIASVIWLLFDMAALRISINDVNSHLLKEIIVKQRDAAKQQATKRTNLVNRIGFKHPVKKVDVELETDLKFANKHPKILNDVNYKQAKGDQEINDKNPNKQLIFKEGGLKNIREEKVVLANNDEKASNESKLQKLHANTKAPIGAVPQVVLRKGHDGADLSLRQDKQKLQHSELGKSGLLQNSNKEVPAEQPVLTKVPFGVQAEKKQNSDKKLEPIKQANESIADKASEILNKVGDHLQLEKQNSPSKEKAQEPKILKPEKEHLKGKDNLVNLVEKQNNVVNKSDPDRADQKAQPTMKELIPPRVEIKANSSIVRKSGMHKVMHMDVTQSPRDKGAVGQFGLAAVVPKDKQEEMRGRWNEGHFNVYLSEQIPVDRAIPDTRPQMCSESLVHDDLPTTSVIFCFVDEVWSTLLRSVHSVLNRSPPHLLKEIILVDDFSTKDYLKDNLDVYMSQFPKVRIIRLKERQGLIRARLAGAACNVGWLEPLLERVYMDRRKVACPVIEVISDKDMRCPVMAGGLFSIDRKYFYELGTYDPGLEVWGGENMEISFKIWMCGGEIEIIPCSRVGHIFRGENPYKFPKDKQKTVERNLARVAEVWLDEYKELFYGHGYHHLLDKNVINIGNLTDQIKLREKLKCKSFKWYLENVYPEMDAPLVRAQGLVFNVGARKCLALEKGVLFFATCDLTMQNQLFNHTWMRHLQHQQTCISIRGPRERVEHLITEQLSQRNCLEADTLGEGVHLNVCNPGNPFQKWHFTHYYTK
ncbi:hypothetical protein JZ751_020086 [Albula glossodonta]|uniref:Polypeptide N-acetylgalactosaminyltransferase n=1 Tax=Albula glossodonta TaxID=121402 RepID=A0A8T2NJK8_9TELE|nr:hypothetical protein JZ751_020086 [Albula glossodonta]